MGIGWFSVGLASILVMSNNVIAGQERSRLISDYYSALLPLYYDIPNIVGQLGYFHSFIILFLAKTLRR